MWFWIGLIVVVVWTYYTYILSIRVVNNFSKLHTLVYATLNAKADGMYYITTMQRMITLSHICTQKKLSEHEKIYANLVCLLYDVYHNDEFADMRVSIDNMLKTEFRLLKDEVKEGIRSLEEPFVGNYQKWISAVCTAKLLCVVEQQLAIRKHMPTWTESTLVPLDKNIEDAIMALEIHEPKSIMELLYRMYKDTKMAAMAETDANLKSALETNANVIMDTIHKTQKQ